MMEGINNDADTEEMKMENGAPKPNEYIRQLMAEKMQLSPETHPLAMRLIDEELQKAQATGKPKIDQRYMDIYKDKPVKLCAKVLVPIKEHPKFNFVGKLLGPKGNSLKRLQEETLTKMAILGRGSMKDKAKEEEYRNSLDAKYAHLADELHVEIQALAPPGEAYARIAFALTEVRKYLIPDVNDEIRQEQFREIQQYSGMTATGGRGGVVRGGGAASPGRGGAAAGIPRPPYPGAGRGMPRPSVPMMPRMPMPPMQMRHPAPPGKSKVISILERIRSSTEASSYGSGDQGGYFADPATAAAMGYVPGYNGAGYFDPAAAAAAAAAYGGTAGNTDNVPPWMKPDQGSAAPGKAATTMGAYFGPRPTPYPTRGGKTQ